MGCACVDYNLRGCACACMGTALALYIEVGATGGIMLCCAVHCDCAGVQVLLLDPAAPCLACSSVRTSLVMKGSSIYSLPYPLDPGSLTCAGTPTQCQRLRSAATARSWQSPRATRTSGETWSMGQTRSTCGACRMWRSSPSSAGSEILVSCKISA